MRIPVIATAIAVVVASAATGVAQDTAPDIVIAAAKNQQGILEYCVAQGHVGMQAVETQARIIAAFPPPQDAAMVEDAYREGQAGTVRAMQIEESLQDAAAAQGMTVAAMCGRLAAAAEQAAAQLSGQ